MRRMGLIFAVLLTIGDTYAQDFTPDTWRHIDTSLAKKKNLLDIHDLVQALKQKAVLAGNDMFFARSIYYQIHITDQRTEDSFYFRNSAIIDTLLRQSQAKPALMATLHFLLANRLSAFRRRYLRFNRQRYERKDIPVNYAAFTDIELDSVANVHYEQSKQLAKVAEKFSKEDVLWLSSEPFMFIFTPTLFDVFVAGQINHWKTQRYYVGDLKETQKKLLSLSIPDFITAIGSESDKASRFAYLHYYKDWLEAHKNNPGTYYYIEMLARRSVSELLSNPYLPDDEYRSAYESYLRKAALSSFDMPKSFAIYQLCLMWYTQSKRYHPKDRATTYYNYSRNNPQHFDTAYRYFAVKALNLFEESETLISKFEYFKKVLDQLQVQIRSTQIHIAMDDHNLPNEPIIAELNYRNLDKIHFRLLRLNEDHAMRVRSRDDLIRQLMQLNDVRRGTIDFPLTQDHNRHSLYVKIDPLPPGNYVLLVSPSTMNVDPENIETVMFRVTGIAVVQDNSRVFVLDRKTGFPLEGATLKASHRRNLRDTGEVAKVFSRKYRVDKTGLTVIKDQKMGQLEVYHQNDTAFSGFYYDNEKEEDGPEDVYDKEEYEDLVEYYEENATVEIFTDRSIYRPGQTVHFKAIVSTRNKHTGERVIMNKKNMKGFLFSSIYRKWLKISDPKLYMLDPFGREVDSTNIRLNDYGSISGSFKIPKTAATGEWSIEPDYLEVEKNEGYFRVEEYKRPTYEIVLIPPKKELLPGDSFTVNIKVKSFAGASLNNVRINYSVSRSGEVPSYEPLPASMSENYSNVEIADSFAYSNNEGELYLVVKEPVPPAVFEDGKHNWSLNYRIRAEAVDMTGESYDASVDVRVKTNSISIRLSLPADVNRNDKNSFAITTHDLNAGIVSKDVNIKMYRIKTSEKLSREKQLVPADLWIHPRSQWELWFPLIDFGQAPDTSRALIKEWVVNSGKGEKVELDPLLYPAGKYEIVATCVEDGKIKGTFKKSFNVFDPVENKLPHRSVAFQTLQTNSLMPGDTLRFFSGNSEAPVYSFYSIKYYSLQKKTEISYAYDATSQEKGIHLWKWRLPADVTDQLVLTQFYVLNNELISHTEKIYINDVKRWAPEVIIEQYRQKLAPGSKETFSVSIKTKNERIASELMTVLYDASLDKIEPHRWLIPVEHRNRYLSGYQMSNINHVVTNEHIPYFNFKEGRLIRPGHEAPLLSLNFLQSDENVMGYSSTRSAASSFGGGLIPSHQGLFGLTNPSFGDHHPSPFLASLNGRAAGVQIEHVGALGSEVVVVGYGSVKNLNAGAASNIIIRGTGSLNAYSQPLIILDGVPYEGDPGNLDAGSIADGIVLKGADAVAIYGARAANGVLVLSTKGPIIFPKNPPEPPPPPRKNFNETAFFFPAIYIDKDGYYKFSFTMPESVTEWNWKIFAHTKQREFVMAERKLNTRMPLMVQPNMPRLLYQGDRIVLQSRISNLDSSVAKGQVSCRIEDAVTGEEITSLFLVKSQNDFSIASKASISSAFEIRVPLKQLNPVRITVAVRSQNFSDGEEHVIPVLSPKVVSKESVRLHLLTKKDTVIQAPALQSDSELLGIGLSIFPRPQSALINSLPYLANYAFDCAEQTFNKLRAIATAIKLMRSDPEAQRSFAAAQQQVDKWPTGKEQLPGELAEQTMPWLCLHNKSNDQQRKLFELLDTSRSKLLVSKHMEQLYKLQNKDGGLTWFPGGKSNPYISAYVLGGFGKLWNDQMMPPHLIDEKFNSYITRLIHYCERPFNAGLTDVERAADWLFNAYARSYWNKIHPPTPELVKQVQEGLRERWRKVNGSSMYDQVQLVVTTLRYSISGGMEYKSALDQLRSIQQLAISDPVNGVRWKDLADSDDMNNAAEETMAILVEAFEEAKLYPELKSGIVKWLLSAKSEDHWSSTKATAAAIQMLMNERQTAVGKTQSLAGVIKNVTLSVTNDLVNGKAFAFTSVSGSSSITLKNENEGEADGQVTWYYFSTPENLSQRNKEIVLKKDLLVFDKSSGTWKPVMDRQLRIADKVKVVLTIETSRALRYVYIDDKRAAAFEPGENHSGYRYHGTVGYYESVRDAGIQVFSDFIPSGRSTISYEMIVAHEGQFTNGPAVLQCMYKPSISAYSNSSVVHTVK